MNSRGKGWWMAKDNENSRLNAGLNTSPRRKQWAKPRLLSMVAGSAENGDNNIRNDGQFTKS